MYKYVPLILFFLLLGLVACEKSSYKKISIKGSDSEVSLVLALAEAYMDQHDDVSISISGGGSGLGIASLINKKTDIANSSRNINEEELNVAKKLKIKPYASVFAMDAIAIIVNSKNFMDSITLKDLSKVYKGTFQNWRELGISTSPIHLYGRQSNSGTCIYLREEVIKGNYATSLIELNGNAQIMQAVITDLNGIGYISAGFLKGLSAKERAKIKVLAIKKNESTKACNCIEYDDVISGVYPLTRPLYQFTDNLPKGEIKAFIAFEKSTLAEDIIQKNGFYPVKK